MRMQILRLARLTNGFAGKCENLWAALCLHFAYYNFCRVHKSLGVTPAMQAGITDRIWNIADLLTDDRATLARTQECPVRDRLMQTYTDALLAYSNIAQTYNRTQWRTNFGEVFSCGERARIDSEMARAALAKHIAKHKCREDHEIPTLLQPTTEL
jgi:hypothetical protein